MHLGELKTNGYDSGHLIGADTIWALRCSKRRAKAAALVALSSFNPANWSISPVATEYCSWFNELGAYLLRLIFRKLGSGTLLFHSRIFIAFPKFPKRNV